MRVNKIFSLVGEYVKTTIIDGGGHMGNVVSIVADNVSLSGFTVRNSTGSGIDLVAMGCTVSGNVAMKCYSGIGLDHSIGTASLTML